MDREVLFRALMAALLALLIWNMLQNWFAPPPPAPGAPAGPALAAGAEGTADTLPPGITVDGAAEERIIELGNVHNDPLDPSPIRLQLSSREASVVSAWLRDFRTGSIPRTATSWSGRSKSAGASTIPSRRSQSRSTNSRSRSAA